MKKSEGTLCALISRFPLWPVVPLSAACGHRKLHLLSLRKQKAQTEILHPSNPEGAGYWEMGSAFTDEPMKAGLLVLPWKKDQKWGRPLFLPKAHSWGYSKSLSSNEFHGGQEMAYQGQRWSAVTATESFKFWEPGFLSLESTQRLFLPPPLNGRTF